MKEDKSGRSIGLIAIVIWSTPLFWAMLTMRSWQKQFAESLGGPNGTDDWSFGQIIAVVVFLPVFNELIYLYLDKTWSAQYGIISSPSMAASKVA